MVKIQSRPQWSKNGRPSLSEYRPWVQTVMQFFLTSSSPRRKHADNALLITIKYSTVTDAHIYCLLKSYADVQKGLLE